MGQTQKLNAAFKTGDRKVICAAIFAEILGTGNVSAFALKAGVDRTMLYRAFKHNPQFDTVLNVMRAANVKLAISGHPGLRVAFETEEVALIVKALCDALSAQRVDRLSPLYRIIRPPQVPRLHAVLTTLKALRLRLTVIRENIETPSTKYFLAIGSQRFSCRSVRPISRRSRDAARGRLEHIERFRAKPAAFKLPHLPKQLPLAAPLYSS
jgi:probable addiction module antidote protein